MRCTYDDCPNKAIILGIDPEPREMAASCLDHLWIFQDKDGNYSMLKKYIYLDLKNVHIRCDDILNGPYHERIVDESKLIGVYEHNREPLLICKTEPENWWQRLLQLIRCYPRYMCIDGNKKLDAYFHLDKDCIQCSLMDHIPSKKEIIEFAKMRGKKWAKNLSANGHSNPASN